MRGGVRGDYKTAEHQMIRTSVGEYQISEYQITAGFGFFYLII
jgi:hypothetical protein